eukprot:04890.XXX_48180_49206_1 [CDS] Oithona nana genome sequencing.
MPEGLRLPEIIITRRTRTQSMNGRIGDEVHDGTVKFFCRSRGHGFIDDDLVNHLIRKLLTKGVFIITLASAAHKKRTKQFSRLALQKNVEKCRNDPYPVFMHISDIEGEFIPRKGDKVRYQVCPMPPRFDKPQGVHIQIIDFTPERHRKWSEKETPEDLAEDAAAI